MNTKFINMSSGQLNQELLHACSDGNLDIVDYLLNSLDISEHANINDKDINNNNLLMIACEYGHNILVLASLSESYDVINFLITDINMEVNLKTMDYLQGKNEHNIIFEKVLKIIQYRDLTTKLKVNNTVKIGKKI